MMVMLELNLRMSVITRPISERFCTRLFSMTDRGARFCVARSAVPGPS